MLNTNYDVLPKLLTQGQVRHSKGTEAYRHTIDGEPYTLPPAALLIMPISATAALAGLLTI